MSTTFIGTSAVQTFTNTHHTVAFAYTSGAVALEPNGGVLIEQGGFADPREPYNGFVEGLVGGEPLPTILEAMADVIPVHGAIFYVEVFDDNSVDYGFSPSRIFVDLHLPTQSGGFAEGDTLKDIFEVSGSAFNDVIRGS